MPVLHVQFIIILVILLHYYFVNLVLLPIAAIITYQPLVATTSTTAPTTPTTPTTTTGVAGGDGVVAVAPGLSKYWAESVGC